MPRAKVFLQALRRNVRVAKSNLARRRGKPTFEYGNWKTMGDGGSARTILSTSYQKSTISTISEGHVNTTSARKTYGVGRWVGKGLGKVGLNLGRLGGRMGMSPPLLLGAGAASMTAGLGAGFIRGYDQGFDQLLPHGYPGGPQGSYKRVRGGMTSNHLNTQGLTQALHRTRHR